MFRMYQVATLAYAIAFKSPSFWGYLWSVLYGVIVDWLLVGLIVASTSSHIANKYLRQYNAHSVEQEVEWLFAFDVHTNAFFCSFFVTYVLQYFLLPILLARGALSCVLSNSLYAIATVWYAYITHLGYRGKRIVSSISMPRRFVTFQFPFISILSSFLSRKHSSIPLVPDRVHRFYVYFVDSFTGPGAANQYDKNCHGFPLRIVL